MRSSKKNHSQSNIHWGHHASFGWPHFLVQKYEKIVVELVVFSNREAQHCIKMG
jgi:hypothetical protein